MRKLLKQRQYANLSIPYLAIKGTFKVNIMESFPVFTALRIQTFHTSFLLMALNKSFIRTLKYVYDMKISLPGPI